MSIKSDNWIRRMAQRHGLIEPFEAQQVRENGGGRIISYGTSSYGYDVRCAREFKIFTNINSTIVDPKHFDEKSFVDIAADVCIIPPNSFALARTVEYFRIPRNVLTVCLGKSTYARCFSGDTRAALANGDSATLEDMARRYDSGERFRGYGLAPDGAIVVAPLERPRFIGRDALIEITLDNHERIRATPDHVFLRRDGSHISAGELRVGHALMPLYREWCRGEEHLYQPTSGVIPVAGRRMGSAAPALRNHKVAAIRELAGDHDVYCLTVPSIANFALQAGVFVQNCGIIVNVTPLEPEWEGHVTLEFSNTTPLPAKIYANEGVAQMLFFESDEVCATSYADRGGKYQGQRGVTLPKA
jgi:deoxycytidine triphosphate deaminase